MKLLNKEFLLISLCALLFAGSLFALYSELTHRINKNSADAIGTITFKKRSAERKYAEYVIWEEIATNSPVYNYDSIRTFESSSAFISLKNGAEISLDADTLIVLIADEKGVKINFDKGAISAKSAGNDNGNISLNSNDVSISMSGGEIDLKKIDNAIDLNVSSGNVTVKSDEGIKNVRNDETAHIEKGKTEVKKISIMPDLPANNSIFVTYKNNDKIILKWNGETTGTDRVELAADSEFARILNSYASSEKSITVDVTPGDYYWRIVSGSDKSPVRRFTLLKDSVPELVYPGLDDTITVTGESEPVNFKWNLSQYASAYNLESALDDKMESNLKVTKVTLNYAPVTNLTAGHVWWAVTRIYPANFILLDTTRVIRRFNLARNMLIKMKPEPVHDGEMISPVTSDGTLLSWKESKGSKGYIVEIAADPEFKKTIKETYTSLTYYKTDPMLKGRYFWRVSADYGDGTPVISETVPLSVVVPDSVTYIYPVKGISLSDQEENIKFSWKDIASSGSYLLECSSDPDFKNIIISVKTDILNYQIRRPAAGKMYWRVSITDRAGKLLTVGETVSFIIPEVLSKPVAFQPSQMSNVNLDHAESIVFKWDRVADADSYDVEIFQRISGIDKPIIIISSDTNRIEVKNFTIFEPGTIVWVIRAKKTANGRILACSESERNYFMLKVNEQISAPKSKAPEIMYVK